MRRRSALRRALPALAAILAAGCLWAMPAWSAVGEPGAASVGAPAATTQVTEPTSALEYDLARARALVHYGRFEEALQLLRPMLRGSTIAADALFSFGLAAVGASQRPHLPEATRDALLDEAIAAFRRMLIDRPDLIRVRLELAFAFFLKHEDRLAQQHFERVLAGNPPPPVVANIHRVLSEIRARRRWTFELGAGFAADDNVGSESAARTIYIIGLPFQRDQEELTESGIGVVLWGSGEYQHPLNARVRLRIGTDISQREFSGVRYDRTTVSGHVGPRWLIDSETEASLLPRASWHWVSGQPEYRDLGGRIEVVRRLGRRVTTTTQVSQYSRRYTERTSLNGPIQDLSLSAAWAVTPIIRLDAGVGWGRERPQAESWQLRRRRLRAGVSVDLPWGFTVGPSGSLEWTTYRGNWFPYTRTGEARSDRTQSMRLSVYNRLITLDGFSPQISIVHEERDTNAQLFDYERTAGELRFVQLF